MVLNWLIATAPIADCTRERVVARCESEGDRHVGKNIDWRHEARGAPSSVAQVVEP